MRTKAGRGCCAKARGRLRTSADSSPASGWYDTASYKAYKPYRCPSVPEGKSRNYRNTQLEVYGMNACITGAWRDYAAWNNTNPQSFFVKITRLGKVPNAGILNWCPQGSPSNVIIYADSAVDSPTDALCSDQIFWFGTDHQKVILRHGGRANILCGDGHASTAGLNDLRPYAVNSTSIFDANKALLPF